MSVTAASTLAAIRAQIDIDHDSIKEIASAVDEQRFPHERHSTPNVSTQQQVITTITAAVARRSSTVSVSAEADTSVKHHTIPYEEEFHNDWPDHTYEPTTAEQLANVLTHAIPVIPSLWCVSQLYTCNSLDVTQPPVQRVLLVYSFVFPALFAASALYHATMFLPAKRFQAVKYCAHWCDRSMIFVFVAGSYTPYLVLRMSSEWAHAFTTSLWTLTAIGTIQQLLLLNRYILIDMALYVGIIVGYAVVTTFYLEDSTGWPMGILGVVVIGCGLVFFFMDGVIPFAHAIWHLHVVVGAFIQYLSLYAYTFCNGSTLLEPSGGQILNDT